MRTFSLFTSDTRCKVPTLTFIVAEDEARAIILAQDNLAESEFHIAVELREGDRRLCKLVKPGVSRGLDGDLAQPFGPSLRREGT